MKPLTDFTLTDICSPVGSMVLVPGCPVPKMGQHSNPDPLKSVISEEGPLAELAVPVFIWDGPVHTVYNMSSPFPWDLQDITEVSD